MSRRQSETEHRPDVIDRVHVRNEWWRVILGSGKPAGTIRIPEQKG